MYKSTSKFQTQMLLNMVLLILLLFSSAQGDLLKQDKPWQEADQIVKVSAMFSYTSAEAGNSYPAALIADISPGWHINSAFPSQLYLIAAELKIDSVEGLSVGKIKYPKAYNIPLLGEEMSVYDGKAVFYFDVTIAESISNGNVHLPLHFTYQPCNNNECRSPETVDIDLIIAIGPDGAPIGSEIFAGMEAIKNVDIESEIEPVQPYAGETSDIERLINEYGFWGYFMALGLAFLTGLLLSFSPCTYPMIPITVSIFAGQERSIGKGFIHSLFYVGSMALVYGIMGMIVSMIGGVFGAWLANPVVVSSIAVIFVIFSLSMFGLYELNVPMSLRQKMGAQKKPSGIAGPIILGIIAALVISPCVGPFVAGILLYIATYGSPIFGFITLFVFAIGLGTLYIILGTFSSAINKLPNAGEWMDQIKKFFGFILLLMALYFLRNIIDVSLTAILAGLLFIALAIFGGGFDRLESSSGVFPRLKKFIGILSFIAGIYLILGTMLLQGFLLPPASEWLPSIGSTPIGEKQLIPWYTDLESGLAQAKSEGNPVLIDTWATWCANCKVLDKKTFGNKNVAAEAQRFMPLRIQLETANSAESKAFMKRFGMKHYSLPAVLLLDSDGNVKKVLQGVTGPEDMIAEMRMVQ